MNFFKRVGEAFREHAIELLTLAWLAFCAFGFSYAFGATPLPTKPRSESLEVVTAVATPQGPQLTKEDGCYTYGSMVATFMAERSRGVPFRFQLERLDAVRGNEKVAGLWEFVRLTVIGVYQMPRFETDYAEDRQLFIDICRDRDGKTWTFPAIGGKAA
jgi:hypothetical protein